MRLRLIPALLAGLVLAAGSSGCAASAGGYAERPEVAPKRAPDSASAMRAQPATESVGLPGLLSIRGLPPIPGTLTVSGGVARFESREGSRTVSYPLYGRHRSGLGRRPAVRLLGIDPRSGVDTVYLFHFTRAVFETRRPGVLRELVENPERVDTLAETAWTEDAPLVDRADTAGMLRIVQEVTQGPFADTLYALFGRPSRPVGLIGPGARFAGRLGEYIASRDSLSLDPAGMRSMEQVRHALVHELAHRWQSQEPGSLASLWKDVPRISDSLRYGYGNLSEQQAEAVAFAIHYLRATNRVEPSRTEADELLSAYERLVPGTGRMVEYFLSRPLFRGHPLNGYSLSLRY